MNVIRGLCINFSPYVQELPEEYFSDDEEIDLDVPAPLLPPEIHRTKSITLEPMTIQEALFQARAYLNRYEINLKYPSTKSPRALVYGASLASKSSLLLKHPLEISSQEVLF